jgi:uncharacterized protein (DUF2252 family)
MRSAVDQILKFNRGFHPYSLKIKLAKMASSPFVFFRGTFHLFARDLLEGPFRKWPTTGPSGQIVGDLHTENFGAYRAITGDIVYDINDFDETAVAPYEYDLRRLTTSLIISALDNKHAMGTGALAAEACVRGYLDGLARLAKLGSRPEFERLKERRNVREVIALAGETARADMLRGLTMETEPGKFVLNAKDHFIPADEKERAAAEAALPRFLGSCLAPKGAHPERYRFEDVAFRIAGCGSLGRRRYAILLGKGKGASETLETLRLVEWKDALDSSLVQARPHQSKNRARDIVGATQRFQLAPKRYLGWTMLEGRPMQAREIGANDRRFAHAEYADSERFEKAARIFGEITARAHLLSTLGKKGPRPLLTLLSGRQDRFVNGMVAFAVAYTDRTLDDYEEFRKRQGEVARAWEA